MTDHNHQTPADRGAEALDGRCSLDKQADEQRQEIERETPDLAVLRLAQLSPLAYDQVREREAEALGVRVSTLDKEVAKQRTDGKDNPQGRAIELYEPEPWPEPVDGAVVLDEARQAIRRYVVLTDEQAITCALWAAHTHVYDLFGHTPRLAITAPHPECAKSLLGAHVVGGLVPRPHPVDLMKPAPFFRLAEDHKPTFLIGARWTRSFGRTLSCSPLSTTAGNRSAAWRDASARAPSWRCAYSPLIRRCAWMGLSCTRRSHHKRSAGRM